MCYSKDFMLMKKLVYKTGPVTRLMSLWSATLWLCMPTNGFGVFYILYICKQYLSWHSNSARVIANALLKIMWGEIFCVMIVVQKFNPLPAIQCINRMTLVHYSYWCRSPKCIFQINSWCITFTFSRQVCSTVGSRAKLTFPLLSFVLQRLPLCEWKKSPLLLHLQP